MKYILLVEDDLSFNKRIVFCSEKSGIWTGYCTHQK